MQINIFPYKNGSKSVNALKEFMDIKAINIKGNSKYKGNKGKIVINWGSSNMSEEAMKSNVINHPDAVKLAANKLEFFKAVQEVVRVPDWTTDKEIARGWIEKNIMVFAREKLSGHSGEGIVILDCIEDFEEYDHNKCKIYVSYIPKIDEYRVHVMEGKVIDIQRKAKLRHLSADDVNYKIRNHANGFVFVREGCDPNQDVLDQALTAVKTCGLDFGAVDVIWNAKRQKAYVLEVNTAPGLEGQTVENYAKGFQELEKYVDIVPNLRRPRPMFNLNDVIIENQDLDF